MWDDLNTPSAFGRDWYGELTNQMAHTLLGVVCAIIWCIVTFAIEGEMPVRAVVFSGIAMAYLCVEIFVQRWKAGDSWFDALMVCLGAAGSLLPFREVSADGGGVMLAFEPRAWVAIFAMWAMFLFLRVYRRYLASNVTQSV